MRITGLKNILDGEIEFRYKMLEDEVTKPVRSFLAVYAKTLSQEVYLIEAAIYFKDSMFNGYKA